MTFSELIYKTGNQEKALNVFEHIYQFLQTNNPEFVTQSNPKLDNEKTTNYVLTNKL